MTKVGALRASVVTAPPLCLTLQWEPPRNKASNIPTIVPTAMASRETIMFQPNPSAR